MSLPLQDQANILHGIRGKEANPSLSSNSQQDWVANQTAHPTMLMQEIWSEIVPTLKSQYDGFKGGCDGVERQRLAFIQQCSFSPFRVSNISSNRRQGISLDHIQRYGTSLGFRNHIKSISYKLLGGTMFSLIYFFIFNNNFSLI